MELEHSFTIPVPVERAWQVLLDVEQVAPCMPGATVETVTDEEIRGQIKVKVGPVMLTYAGSARFTEKDEQARTVTLAASGRETRGSGTASATVRSSLRDEGGQTRVTVHTTMSVTGRPAQFGRGVMTEVGGRIIERFASNLAGQLTGAGQPSPAAGPAQPPAGEAAGRGGPAPGAPPVPVEELGLPARAVNVLRRNGVLTAGDLAAHTEEQLRAMGNLGPQSLKEIKQRLADRGLALASAPAPAEAGPTQAAEAGPTQAAGPAPEAAGQVPPAPQAARPPDEEAIDLLSVAGFPVLKRALPVVAGAGVVLLLVLQARRRLRRRAGGA